MTLRRRVKKLEGIHSPAVEAASFREQVEELMKLPEEELIRMYDERLASIPDPESPTTEELMQMDEVQLARLHQEALEESRRVARND